MSGRGTGESGRVRAVVVGASGYAGAELIEILLGHGGVELVGLFGSGGKSADDRPLAGLWPRFRGRCGLAVRALGAVGGEAGSDGLSAIIELRPDAVFLATPHEASVDLVAGLVDRVGVVVDLSAAYRLSKESAYPKHYGFTHHHAGLLGRSVYGLPELGRERLKGARLIAAPGCYPTSAIIPLWPLVRGGAIKAGCVPVVDSTSGVSGAGRTPSVRGMFCEVSQSPYGVLRHRHGPEIEEHAGTAVHFVPHLGPYDRGILTTIHVELAAGWSEGRVRELLQGRYGGERFVRVLPTGEWPSVGAVRGTNYCDVGLVGSEDGGHLVLCSAIDNLVKGASGQAVQGMNVALGLEESAGLL